MNHVSPLPCFNHIPATMSDVCHNPTWRTTDLQRGWTS
jgi:hypothetical protein